MYLQQAWGVGEVRACRVVRFSRTSHRYTSCRYEQTPLRARIKEIAYKRVRYGYQRIHVILRREGWLINHKRTYRLHRLEGLNLGIENHVVIKVVHCALSDYPPRTSINVGAWILCVINYLTAQAFVF